VAARLASNIRSIDILSRYGGEEFLVAMPDTKQDEAVIAADRIRSLLGGSTFRAQVWLKFFKATTSGMCSSVQMMRCIVPNKMAATVSKLRT